jgi:glycosyltransferase involved in cell wall biosynthesis
MNIGFDAKRAYHNQTGLGHYSRTLIQSLAAYYPQHAYYLFNPKPSSLFQFQQKNIIEVLPKHFFSKQFSSLWRQFFVKGSLTELKIDLYHGLSHEIPYNLQKQRIKAVVTIHDLIHERFPHQYKAIDRKIYTAKFHYACKHADKVIAISQQTKEDIIQFYKIDPQKIEVCYQGCNPAFATIVAESEKQRVKELYNLPDRYFLYVGSVIERKNLLVICKAFKHLHGEMDIPLVVIGNGSAYKEIVKAYVQEAGIAGRIIFLADTPIAKTKAFQSAQDFPAIYQQAIGMIYPSTFEGFGIPVLEALNSRIPVITSNVSCLPEAGGDAAFYVDPLKPEEIAVQMKLILTNETLVKKQVEKGWAHAQQFTNEKCAAAVMKVYEELCQ